MKVFHIQLAKTGLGVSGGEVCMLEQIKFFMRKNIKNIVITTDQAPRAYLTYGLEEGPYLQFKTIQSYRYEQSHHVFLSYIRRVRQARKLVKELSVESGDVIICHSSFFPDSITARLLAVKNPESKIFYWFHLLSPRLFYGYRGEFSGIKHFPSLPLVHMILSQKLYSILALRRGVVLNVNSYYAAALSRLFPKSRVYTIKQFGGLDFRIKKDSVKYYDFAWMGRFQDLKNIQAAVSLISNLKQSHPNVKLLIMGGGDEGIKLDLVSSIKKLGLEKNITYKGFVSGDERFKLLSQCKIFLMTSVFESYGLVILEAMRIGLPVLAFNLPVYEGFKAGIVKVPLNDEEAMTAEASKLLTNLEYYNKLRLKAVEFSSSYSWSKTFEEIFMMTEDK